MLRMSVALGVFALAVAASGPGPAGEGEKDEMVPNPLYKAWANFKPGTVAKHKEVVKYGSGGTAEAVPGEGIEEKDIFYQLVGVSKDRVLVRVIVHDYEALSIIEAAPTRIAYPARVKRSYLEAVRGRKIKEGEEEIKVLGKPMKCRTIELRGKGGDGDSTVKIYLADSIPGGIVKQIKTTRKGKEVVSEATVTLLEYKIGTGKVKKPAKKPSKKSSKKKKPTKKPTKPEKQ
jgi:hypothetical protein